MSTRTGSISPTLPSPRFRRCEEPRRLVFLAPSASLLPVRNILQGDSTLRVVHDDFEITGARWIYHHAEKSVFIRQDVRVTFHEELQSILR